MINDKISRRQLLASLGVAGVTMATVGLEFGSDASAKDSVTDNVYDNKNHVRKYVIESMCGLKYVPDLIGYEGECAGQQVPLIGYHSETSIGGGVFYWDADQPKSTHNGGTVISPTVPWDGTSLGLIPFLQGSGETAPSGFGCWLRLRERRNEFCPGDFGALGIGNEQDVVQAVVQAARQWADGEPWLRPILVFDKMYTVKSIVVYDRFILVGPGGLIRANGVISDASITNSNVIFGNGIKDIDICGLLVDGNDQNQGIMNDSRYRKTNSAGALGYQNIYIIGKFTNTDHEMGTIRIQNCRIINSPGNGIVVNNHSQAVIMGNHIERCGKNGMYLAQTHGFNTSVTGNYIRECGFIYGGGIGVAHSHVNVNGNVIVSCYEYGILISSTGVGARWNTDITVTSNNVRGVKKVVLDTSGNFNSYINSPLGVGIGYTQVFVTRASARLNIAVTGNTVQGAENSGIAFLGAAYNANFLPQGIAVVGNSVMLCGGSGINIRYIRGVVCQGNMSMANFFSDIYLDDVSGAVVSNSIVCDYKAADRVVYKNIKYEAALRHFSTEANRPDLGGSYWTIVQTSETLPEWHEDEVYSPAIRPLTYAIYTIHRPGGITTNGMRSDLLIETNSIEGATSANQISNANLARRFVGRQTPIELPVLVGDRIHYNTPTSGGREGRICIIKGTDTATGAWVGSQSVVQGIRRQNAVKLYEATTSGTTGATAPVHTSGEVSDGGVIWKFIDTVAVFKEFGTIDQ